MKIENDEVEVDTWARDAVVVLSLSEQDTSSPGELVPGFAIGKLTPVQAIALSRALVKAAAEALGVQG